MVTCHKNVKKVYCSPGDFSDDISDHYTNQKKLKYFSTYSLITPPIRQSDNQTTMTTTNANANANASYNDAITAMYGLPRMVDAEPEVPFNTVDTPRPNTSTGASAETETDADADAEPSFATIFANAAKHAATKMKHRRSLKTRTHYCISASSRVQKALQRLEIANADSHELSPSDLKLLKSTLDRHRVRLDVGDRLTAAELKTLLLETRSDEQEAERITLEAFKTNTEHATAVEEASEAVKYCEAREKYSDLKYWREALVKEEMRVTPMPMMMPNWGYGNKKAQDTIPTPTQHAQITTSAGNILRNILKPETIRRKTISLKILTQQISEEVEHFLTDPDRHADRKCVVKQIKDAISAAAVCRKQ